jgi:hypothetical protein
MIADVRKHLHAVPFRPFFIVMSSGQRYRVATADHAGFDPRGSRVVVWLDDEGSITISGLHITAVETESKNGSTRGHRKRGQ